jgi:hypothetical protein
MIIERQKPTVYNYHFDQRIPQYEAEHGVPETKLNVNLQVMDRAEFDIAETDTLVHVDFRFQIILETTMISGVITQIALAKDHVFVPEEQVSQEISKQFAEPLFDILQRLTYEVTEIAFDEPGITIEF